MDRVVVELNELEPDVVLCTGDLTEMGFRQDYVTAKEYLRPHRGAVLVVPGNHDARNVGYVHFEELIGPRWHTLMMGGVKIVALDSSEPDLDYGQIGRAKYEFLREEFAQPADFRDLHAAPPRAADPGHRPRAQHGATTPATCSRCCRSAASTSCSPATSTCPYAWRLEHLFVVNAGTCSSLRLRGNTKACYNLIRIEDDRVQVARKYPFHGEETLIDFVPSTASFDKYICPVPQEESR